MKITLVGKVDERDAYGTVLYEEDFEKSIDSVLQALVVKLREEIIDAKQQGTSDTKSNSNS